MTHDRLTRDELTWLLAQEARAAAQRLRRGVGVPASREAGAPTMADEGGGVELTLNRLDEAVGMLASLHGQPSPRGRRGKVDLAALLWEVAPDARVQIEMGEGTTVLGDESELRRMLLVLVGQSGDPASAKGSQDVSVRREGDKVRVSVGLGPDQPATFEAERAWLSRMATRYSGALTLDGSVQVLTLPAELDQRRELESLKRELAETQARGGSSAHELSHAKGGSTPTPPAHDPAAAAPSLASRLREGLAAIGRDLDALRGEAGELDHVVASIAGHLLAASELLAKLEHAEREASGRARARAALPER